MVSVARFATYKRVHLHCPARLHLATLNIVNMNTHQCVRMTLRVAVVVIFKRTSLIVCFI